MKHKPFFFLFLLLGLGSGGYLLSDVSFWLPELIRHFEGKPISARAREQLVRASQPITRISRIQGSGDQSPLVGQWVTVEAVVTGDFQSFGKGAHGDLDGFFLQEESGDQDDSPDTSEGIFVYDGPKPKTDVRSGDVVRVHGQVKEYYGETEIDVRKGWVETRRSGVSVSPTALELPADKVTQNADGEWIADMEAREGMLVRLPAGLTIAGLHHLERFGEVTLAASGRPFVFTETSRPDQRGYLAFQKELARHTLILDDGLSRSKPEYLPFMGRDRWVRVGDKTKALTGVLRFSRSAGKTGQAAFRLEPVAPPATLAASEPAGPPEKKGGVRIVGFNVHNFFTTLDQKGAACFPTFSRRSCRGADTREAFLAQKAKLVQQMGAMNADIFVLVELENNGTGEGSAIRTLVEALNQSSKSGCSGYRWVETGERLGGDAITAGMVYCPDTVIEAPGARPASSPERRRGRPALAVSFQDRKAGEIFTLVALHLKSKSPSSLGKSGQCRDEPESVPDCDQQGGQGFWNARRLERVKQLDAWLKTHPTGVRDPDVAIIGDLNAYTMEDPIRWLVQAGYVSLAEKQQDDPVYSYVFDGLSGTLDHALLTPGLASRVRNRTYWHVNADFPRSLDNHSLYRASDHDPLILDLSIPVARR